MKRALASIVTVGSAVLWAALPAAADTAPAGTVAAVPANVGAASHIGIDAKGTGAGFGGTFPVGVTLAFFKGFSLDLAAAGRCSDSDATAGTCPATSQIASGFVMGNASLAGLFSQAITAPVSVFLANASGGDLADVVFEATVQGTVEAARGQLVAANDPTFGYEFRFDPLPMVMAPLGTTVTLTEFALDVGASATGTAPTPVTPPAKKCRYGHYRSGKCKPRPKTCKYGRLKSGNCKSKPKHRTATKAAAASAVEAATVTHNLITNPTTCSGSWPTELRIRYTDHTQILDAAIGCTP